MSRPVEAFFYGLFMDVGLLRSQGASPVNPRRAYVEGFALHIGQRATLVPAAGARAYGMLMGLTPNELTRLYAPPGLQHYVPEAVLAQTDEGERVPALCYNLTEPPGDSEQNPEYAAKLKSLLQSLNFPADYIASVQ